VYFAIVAKLSTALVKALNLVEICILDLWQEILVYPTALDPVCELAWSLRFVNILF
jgi:hypothetical protein